MAKTLKRTLSQRKSKLYEDIQYTCTVRFLDDSDPLSVSYQKEHKGQWLIDHVCRELNLEEKDYFGLRFVDTEKQRVENSSHSPSSAHDSTDALNNNLNDKHSANRKHTAKMQYTKHWLDPLKPVYKQLKQVSPCVLCFRVKFYPADPVKLKEELTRYFLFLQLKRDLHHGRLLCLLQDANLLAAYIIQSECGDYNPEDHPPGYVSKHKMLPKQTAKQEEKIAELHKTIIGQSPSDSETNFITKAASLDTYGVDPHPVKYNTLGIPERSARTKIFSRNKWQMVDAKTTSHPTLDQKGNQMYLGVTHLGIVTFQGNKRTHLFKWPQISKIAFEGKMFIVHVTISEDSENSTLIKKGFIDKPLLITLPTGRKWRGLGTLGSTATGLKKHACGFKCATFTACKHLWKCAKEQQYFFTLEKAAEAPRVTSGGGFFSRGTKFRFSGRCQKEVYSESNKINRMEPRFIRSCSNPSIVRSYNKLRSESLPNSLKNKSLNDSNVRSTPHLAKQDAIETDNHPIETNLDDDDDFVNSRSTTLPRASKRRQGQHVMDTSLPVGNGAVVSPNDSVVSPNDSVVSPKDSKVSPNDSVISSPGNNTSHVSTDSSMQSLTHGEIDFDITSNGEVREIQEGFPREDPVQVSDKPYDPVRSPTPESPIQSIPESPGEEETEEVSRNLEAELRAAETQDLFLTTQEVPLLTEPPEMTQSEPAIHLPDDDQTSVMTTSQPPDPPEQIASTEAPETPQQPESPAEPARPVTTLPQPPFEQGLKFCKFLTWTFLLMFTIMSIVAIFVLESELDMPVLRDIRQMPEVQDFKHQHYDRLKTTATKKMGGWFK